MGQTNSQIVLDSPTGVYYSGTNVTGRLQFTLDEPKTIRAIKIQFLGVAKTSWTDSETVWHNEGDRRTQRTEHKTFSAREEFFSNEYTLVGGPNSEIEIPPGEHVYSFITTLPPFSPSSFEGKHGNIRYTITATFDLPWKFNQHVTKVFTVVTPVDLNYNVQAKLPVKLEIEKSFCCFWCKSGPLTVVINLPYSGFVPGQSIPITLEVDNASDVQVDRIIIKLKKVLKWKAQMPKNKERQDDVEIARVTVNAVEPHGSKSEIRHLTVPGMLICNLDQCSIINCSFRLKVIAEVSGVHSNLYGEVPIFLGTVPIYQAAFAPPAGAFTPSAPPTTNDQTGNIGFNTGSTEQLVQDP